MAQIVKITQKEYEVAFHPPTIGANGKMVILAKIYNVYRRNNDKDYEGKFAQTVNIVTNEGGQEKITSLSLGFQEELSKKYVAVLDSSQRIVLKGRNVYVY